jgi:hypothetical protein
MSGMQRTTTVTQDDRWAGLRLPDLGDHSGPKLHGMQGVMAVLKPRKLALVYAMAPVPMAEAIATPQ